MRFPILYADPPWMYNQKHMKGYEVCTKYSCMTEEEISALDVKSLADRNSACFMWVTSPLLDVGIRVLNAWGFKFSTVGFVWLKTNGKSRTPKLGMGFWTLPSVEVCLIGIRGRCPPRAARNIRQLVTSDIQRHSQKPEEVRQRIDALFEPSIPRVELFSRAKPSPAGWVCTGFDSDGIDVRKFIEDQTKNSACSADPCFLPEDTSRGHEGLRQEPASTLVEVPSYGETSPSSN